MFFLKPIFDIRYSLANIWLWIGYKLRFLLDNFLFLFLGMVNAFLTKICIALITSHELLIFFVSPLTKFNSTLIFIACASVEPTTTRLHFMWWVSIRSTLWTWNIILDWLLWWCFCSNCLNCHYNLWNFLFYYLFALFLFLLMLFYFFLGFILIYLANFLLRTYIY